MAASGRSSRHLVSCFLVAAMAAMGARAEGILPSDVTYEPEIPTPEEVLGQEIGRWHLRHDQLARYLEVLAESSDRLHLLEQGRTHEGRRQLLLIATTPENHARLDEIRRLRRALTDPSLPAPSADELASIPSVVFLGYSVHGNEASGSNASPLVAYYLAAAQDPRVDEWLSDTVVLIDPSLNPDGMGRFAQWANMHRGVQAVGDPDHREHREGWPSGRTNHYWFDLNRDWLLLQHPESRARVRTYQEWKPNVLGDYHEMGSDSTYFFQPGVPERESPYKPQRNVELTAALAELHARNLDADGQLYYSQETFDDFYPGKGSTYPDLAGGVGVLFEQASARGHLQDTDNGELTFERAIRNHFLTSLSMIEGTATLRPELLAYQAEFHREALELAAADETGAFVFGCPGDAVRCAHLVKILRGHQIAVHELGRGLEIDGESFDPAWSWIVPTGQPQYRLVKALFERQTEFRDSTFYDVSSWTLPLAFGTRNGRIPGSRLDSDLLGAEVALATFPVGRFDPDPGAYAYLFEWRHYFAPRALHRLQRAGFRARVATEPFQARTSAGERDFDYGTIVVPADDAKRRPELEELLRAASERDGVDVWTATTGLTPVGVDLGSPAVLPLEEVRPLIVGGRGVSSYEVGEAWYLLDHRFGIGVSIVEMERMGSVDLEDYTHIIMVNGSYEDLDESTVEAIERWVSAGGVLVATKRAANWVDDVLLAGDDDEESEGDTSADSAPAEQDPPEERRGYADYDRDRAAELVSGAIFEVELDVTHPMAFGYSSDTLPIFRNSTLELAESEDPYELVARYAAEPLLSGYISDGKLADLSGRPAVIASRHGSGAIVRLVDNPNFRAFWYGTSKLFLNGLFFGTVLQNTSPPSDW